MSLWLLCLLCGVGPDSGPLLQPFTGFDEAGMRPVLALFDEDSDGRRLLQRAQRKLGVSRRRDLLAILGTCSPEQLGGDRRGLYLYQVHRAYRPKRETRWRDLTPDTVARLEDPGTWPVMEQRSWYTVEFEQKAVVFQPRICLASGLTVLDAYLVLVHELTHLTGMDPFEAFDPLRFEEANRERDYYFPELMRDGGEVEAYLAQVKAMKRLRTRYELNRGVSLERLVDDSGYLAAADRPAFMRELLYTLGYAQLLDRQLADQVVHRYNTSYAWWRYFEEVLAAMNKTATDIQAALDRYEAAREDPSVVIPPEVHDQVRDMRRELARLKARAGSFRAERDEHIALMDRLDARYPRN